MYYEEKLIDNILHFRTTLNGEWKPIPIETMSQNIIRYQNVIDDQAKTIQRLFRELGDKKMNSKATPRTDEHEWDWHDDVTQEDEMIVPAAFARELELENIALEEQLREWLRWADTGIEDFLIESEKRQLDKVYIKTSFLVDGKQLTTNKNNNK